MKRVAILGSGGMGTALAVLFAKTARSVQIWSRDRARAEEFQRSRENRRHLPGIVIPDNVTVMANACDATSGADLVVVSIPSAYLRSTLDGLSERIPPAISILSVVKGIENESFARPSEIIVDTLGKRSVAILSGPSHAEEFAAGLPASVVVAGEDQTLNLAVRDSLNQGMFRVYTNPDALGVELAGALKNILGIAAGICDGLQLGDNAKAALLTRGLAEITRFGVSLGALPATFSGLAGLGDLITTCYSSHGRNRMVGERIGQGETLDQILAGMVNVAEGVPTTLSVTNLAHKQGIELPIIFQLHRILFEGKPPLASLVDLMDRIPKTESTP